MLTDKVIDIYIVRWWHHLFFEAKDLNDHIDKVDNELKNVAGWCVKNKLTINLEKTNCTVMKNHQNRKTLMPYPIKFFDKAIEQVNDAKFLGVVFDQPGKTMLNKY